MAVFTRGNYNCACSREVCDWACTTYATMMSDLVPNTASQPFKILSKPFGDGLDVCPVCGKPSTIGKPMTNADRIRSMTDEELAEWVQNTTGCPTWVDKNYKCPDMYQQKKKGCSECWLEWLKQEYTP